MFLLLIFSLILPAGSIEAPKGTVSIDYSEVEITFVADK